jgi:hypothetical protein
MISRRLQRAEDIQDIIAINGVAIGEVERRCMALEDRREDAACWRMRTASGYLGRSESLRGRMAADSEVVTTLLGTTHTGVAAALRRVVGVAESERRRRGKSPWCPVVLALWQLHPAAPPQRLLVESTRYNAPQLSPFASDAPGVLPTFAKKPPPWPAQAIRDPEEDRFARIAGGLGGWDVDHRITNEELGLGVLVAEGVIGFIAEIGFYEGGGPTNPYRVDPVLLSAVLGGTVPHPHAAHTAIHTGEALAEKLLAECVTTVAAARSTGRDADSIWAAEHERRQSLAATHIREHWQTIADRLHARSTDPVYQCHWQTQKSLTPGLVSLLLLLFG